MDFIKETIDLIYQPILGAEVSDTFANISQWGQNFSGVVKFFSFVVSLVSLLLIFNLVLKIRAIHNPTPQEAPETPKGQEGQKEKAKEEKKEPTGYIQARWDEIVRHIDSTKEAEWKFAIIEADKLMDSILKKAGFPGETLGEKLMNTSTDVLATLEGLWQAHKVRNLIAHDPDFTLRYADARIAIQRYQATLKELGAVR